MIDFTTLRFLLGHILMGLAVVMLAPCAVAWYIDSPDLMPFAISQLATMITALLLFLTSRGHTPRLRVREMFLLTNLSWLSVCTFGALPFVLSHTVGNFTDAVFESVSGVTTTGATVLTGLDTLPKDILLWRSMMQWIGGLGIVALGAAVLPFLRIGGMRLFRTESSHLSEKALPRMRRMLNQLLIIYLALSVACACLYWLAGMSFFDAICHSMTTVSTGGFSTHDTSMAYFDSPVIHIIAIVFMLLAAIPFLLYLPILQGRRPTFLQDGQVQSLLFIYLFVAAILAIWLITMDQAGFAEAVREAAFCVVAIATTTGYVTADYMSWGGFAVIVIFYLTFVGGCSGSTSGGIKIFRINVAFGMFRETIKRLLHPNATLPRSLHGQALTDEIASSVMAFSLAFAGTVGFAATLLAVAGNDFVTSLSAAATATANVGPGIGDVIGPTQTFASLTQSSKWIICAAMLLGRLEIFTMLILLTPAFWRD